MRSHAIDRASRGTSLKAAVLRAAFVAAALVAAALVAGVRADAAAPAGRYTIGTATVYDTKTKLTWQRAPAAMTYNYDNARAYCASAEVATALGGTGWRLPTKKELLTLVDYSVPNPGPTIDAVAFPGTPTSEFWSATPVASTFSVCWGVAFDTGGTATLGRGDTDYVRCVR